jgi:hypothetical protein
MRAIKELVRRGVLQEGVKTLDFGAGKGVLLDRLLKQGFDAWGHDPYPHPEHARDHVSSEMPASRFPLITCIEVLEHTLDPKGTLGRLRDALDSGGVILLSTEFFDETKHGSNWWYLVPEHGQHVTIFSHNGFLHCVEAAGLYWQGTIQLNGRPFLHVLSREKSIIEPKLMLKISRTVHRWNRVRMVLTRMRSILYLLMEPKRLKNKLKYYLSSINKR